MPPFLSRTYHYRALTEEKGRICYECESQYINPKGTGVTAEEACAEYDRDYDEVKDMIDI